MADIAAPSQLLSSVAPYPDPCPTASTSGSRGPSPRTLSDNPLDPPNMPIKGDTSKHKVSLEGHANKQTLYLKTYVTVPAYLGVLRSTLPFPLPRNCETYLPCFSVTLMALGDIRCSLSAIGPNLYNFAHEERHKLVSTVVVV